MIFPRFHQLDAVRKISEDVLQVGAGKNYLVQHSAGSGKSNSIAWLAYRLTGLHNAANERIFDSVIVVTDRRVLDRQLQDTIYQFEHKTGVVQKIDKDSTQLAEALGQGTNIIITTLQKFPFVVDKVGELPDRKYAVVIDEAHSSQGGETSKKMKEVLSAKSLEDAAASDTGNDYTGDDFVREQIDRSAAARAQQSNISFFAFTATPKYKTLQVFGDKDLPAPRPQAGQFCIYVLKCSNDSFHIGQTQNFPRRLTEHERGEVSWTSKYLPVELIHWEIFNSIDEAVDREKKLKTGFGRKWLKREFEKQTLAKWARQAGAEGKPKPFHLYSMRQAIEEGFILDVLQNYITYDLYFKLTKAIEDDPELNKKKAAKAIGKFVSLHPHNLAQKTEIIIEHFRNVVSKKIGGKAKAMLVCGSRLHAKRYFEEFGRYIKEKGYANEMKILVAFSGKGVDDNTPDGVSEPELTGWGEKEIPTVFEKEEYKILIVADKYQTGFDQPLLHTMYVDKKLSGVKAVQTLSRLNRTCPGKEDTFVLDFANERQTILDSFQPYYEITAVTEETDVNHLYDLKARLDEFQVYWEQEINEFAQIYFDPKTKLNNPKQQKHLYAYTDPAVDRYKGIEEEEKQDEFKKGLRTWTNLYAFLSQIMPFSDSELEKFYAYAKLLQTRLPKRELSEALHLDDEVALEYYRLQKIKEGAIELEKGEEDALSGTSEAGLKKAKEEEALLSQIINVLNDRFGTEFEEADKLFFDQIEAELMEDETLQTQARVNKLDTFKYAFYDKFIDKLIGRMDQNQDIFEKIMEDKVFGDLVKELMMKKIYKKMNA